MKKVLRNKMGKAFIAWLLVVCMVVPMLPSGIIAKAAEVSQAYNYHNMSMEEILGLKDRNLTWVFAGDSITHNGSWSQGMNSYSEWFEQYLYDIGRGDDAVINTAWGGADIQDFQVKDKTVSGQGSAVDAGMGLEKMITDYNPDVVFIKLGMNNRSMATAEFVELYQQMLNDIYAAGEAQAVPKKPKIVILTPTPLASENYYDNDTSDANKDSTLRLRNALEKIAADNGNLLFCDLRTAFIKEAEVLGADYHRTFFSDPSDGGIHPNAAGQYFIFKTLSKTLGIYDENKAIYQLEYQDINQAALYVGDTTNVVYNGEYSNVSSLTGDEKEINKKMPSLEGVQPIASVDFSPRNTKANGSFVGKDKRETSTEISLTDESVCNDALTLDEIKGLGTEYSIVLRAKLDKTSLTKGEQPILVIRNNTLSGWGNGLYVGLPGTTRAVYSKAAEGGTTISKPNGAHMGNGGAGLGTMSGNIAGDGVWHTVAVVQSKDKITYYVDGEVKLDTSLKIAGDNQTIGGLLNNVTDISQITACIGTFGGVATNSSWNLSAKMDYYQFYDKTLTEAQVQELSGMVIDEDAPEINKEMPELSSPANVELLASVDFATTKAGAKGSFGGSNVYATAKNDEISLTDETVCDDALTLDEIKSLGTEYSIVFRAKLGKPALASAQEQPVLALMTKHATGWGTGLYVGVPGNNNNMYMKATQSNNAISIPSAARFAVGSGSNIAADSTWHTVALVQSKDTFTYYVDGEARKDMSMKIAGDNQTIGDLFADVTDISDVVACVGTYGGVANSSWNLNAKMDYYQLYKGALSADEVATLTAAADSGEKVVKWSDIGKENSVWVAAGAEQMSGYEGPVVNRSLYRFLDNVVRGGSVMRDIRTISVADKGYTVAGLNRDYSKLLDKHLSNKNYANTVFILLPEVSEAYSDTYQHSASLVNAYKENIEALLKKSKADVNVLWTPLASGDEKVNAYITAYAEAVRQIADGRSDILFFDANLFMNENMEKDTSLKRNWFEENMYISPLCATDVAYAFFMATGLEIADDNTMQTGITELSNHNLRDSEDKRTFKGNYIRDYIKANASVDGTTVTVDVSAITAEAAYQEITFEFAALPGVAAGNYHKDLFRIADVTKSGDSYTFEAPCKKLYLAVYGKSADGMIYRFKDLALTAEGAPEAIKKETVPLTKAALDSLEVVGAPAITLEEGKTEYNVSLYQYQKEVRVRAKAQEGLTITVNGKKVASGAYSERIAVENNKAAILVTVSGTINGTEQTFTYTLNLTSPEYPDIIVTEVMSHGYWQYESGTGSDNYELIEIYNASGRDLNLADYSIGYKQDYTYTKASVSDGQWPYYFTGNDQVFGGRSDYPTSYTGINEITKFSTYTAEGADTEAAINFPADSTMVIWVKHVTRGLTGANAEAESAKTTYDTLITALKAHAGTDAAKTLEVDVDGTMTAVVPVKDQIVVAEVPKGVAAQDISGNRAVLTEKAAFDNFYMPDQNETGRNGFARGWLFVLDDEAKQASNGAITEAGNDIISAANFLRLSSSSKLSTVLYYDALRGMSVARNAGTLGELVDTATGKGYTSDVTSYRNLTSFGAIEYWQKPADTKDETKPTVTDRTAVRENMLNIDLGMEDDTDVRYLELNVRQSDGTIMTVKKDLVMEAGIKNAGQSADITSYDYTQSVAIADTDGEIYYWGYIMDGNGNKTEIGSEETPVSKECQYRVESYDIAPYRGATYTAPELKGYVFAGWYEAEDCETAIAKEVKEGTYFAKFVPEHVLSVKAQISANLLNVNPDDDDTGAIRFVTTVDSRKYKEVGFIFDIENGAQNYKVSNNLVYKQLFAVNPLTGDKEQAETLTPKATFCNLSEYFKTCTFYQIPQSQYGVKITATPFWETLDGTVVTGAKATKAIEDAMVNDFVYVSSANGSDENTGTKAQPYASLNKALEAAKNGDIIYIVDTYQVESPDTSWAAHGKDVIITGGVLDFTAGNVVNLRDGVTFKNMTLNFQEETSVYANGNRLKIDSDTIVNGVLLVYGAGDGGTVESTDVTLLSGNYKRVFGAGVKATVNGDTNIYIAGDVNKTREYSSSSFVIYGAGNQGTVKGNTNVTVGGNTNSTLKLTSDPIDSTILYGGSSNGSVEGSTNVTVEGNAQFNSIYGGGYQGTIGGDTHVTIKGTVNGSMKEWTDPTKHTAYASIYGGSLASGGAATVTGDTYVTIDGNAYFMYIYGGAAKVKDGAGSSTVGNTNVVLTENASQAKIMSIYGGSYYATNKNTSVIMKAGESQQVIGGSIAASMEGNTDVQVLGGKVTRRIYGGCYNDYKASGWVTSVCVKGTTNVRIGTGVTIAWDNQDDHALVARSRGPIAADETAIMIVEDYENNPNRDKVGTCSFFAAIRINPYDSLVKEPAELN